MRISFISLPEAVGYALMVIAGEFGNGEQRKENLRKAGQDPERVQGCVNDLLPIIKKWGD